MPCYRCDTRQTDPERGRPSPWKRGVRGGVQVLVCPDCQRVHDWVADLDQCGACGSTALVRELDQVRCRECGATASVDPGTAAQVGAPGLADDVAAALARRFGSADSL